MTIDHFRGEHAFLSNFYAAPVTYRGVPYPSVEHAYQAAKSDPPAAHLAGVSAANAKKMGRGLRLRPDWEQVKVGVMRDLLRLKFAIPELRAMLLATGDARLVESNSWGDSFWGVYHGRGENWLGRLLVEVREEIRAEHSDQGVDER